MAICVLGMGYVGLTLALVLAEEKQRVYGIDIDKSKIEKLSKLKPVIYEPGIINLLREVSRSGFFSAHEKLSENMIKEISTYILCIGTPINEAKDQPVLDYLIKSFETLLKKLKSNDLIIIRSTVPVGTANGILRKLITEKRPDLILGKNIFLASAPERTVEGNALDELRKLPQIVGSNDPTSIDKTASIFNKITKTVIRVSSFESAEVIKLIDNTFRDVSIALGNQFGLLAEKLGLDINQIIDAANYGYNRNKILRPGAGVGGPCLVKDPYFLLSSVSDKVDIPLIRLARKINESMPHHVVELIEEIYSSTSKSIASSNILILGFAFKGVPQTDDTRSSPTIGVVDELRKKGANLFGYDPMVSSVEIEKFGVNSTTLQNLPDIDCIVIMNNNPHYQNLDFTKILEKSSKPIGFLDGWQMFKPTLMEELGFVYRGIGIGIKQ